MTKNTNDKVHEDILGELGVTNEFDGVSTADLTAEEKRLDIELKRLELAERLEKSEERKRKKQERKEQFEAAMRAIQMELARRQARQRGCSHRKGGVAERGAKELPNGTDGVFALLKHQLPSGDWWILCQRCGGEWYPEDRFTGKPATIIGGFSYRDALMAPTDNSPSKSCVFRLEDHRSDDQIAADAWKPPRNEKGEVIKDMLAEPLGEGPLQPPPAVAKR
jgi:hypothetical protein